MATRSRWFDHEEAFWLKTGSFVGVAIDPVPNSIPGLQPRSGSGHQFVIYGDSCSGIHGGRHEATFANVNRVISRLSPPPEFVCFLGDEIVGLSHDAEELRRQWRYWRDHEMSWLSRAGIPLYHTTGNHTIFDVQSEKIFREMLPALPQNGPSGQQGLSYHIRRGDLLLVFVNTLWSGFGVEGQVETDWLKRTLNEQADARFKFVLGHHPVFATNGNAAPFQRTIEPANGKEFWDVLVEHRVIAYLCSHMLAFDVQVHRGVLQIMTAGAGTSPLMPPDREYHHAVQMSIDDAGPRYQVLDEKGTRREELAWPLSVGSSSEWPVLGHRDVTPESQDGRGEAAQCWSFRAELAAATERSAQTLLAGWHDELGFAPVWIGITAREPFLAVLLTGERGRSPHLWRGPSIKPDEALNCQICIHADMGPGGVLYRGSDDEPWTSMVAASAWGPGHIPKPSRWSVGHGPAGRADRPFRGSDFIVRESAGSFERLERP